MQTVMDHIQKTPQAPSQRTSAPIPREIDDILLQCLRKDPNERPQTMQDLAESLRRIPFESPWTQERARRWWLENASRRDLAPLAVAESAPHVVTIAGLADRR
jgi:serine/threonine-protein kinase